MAAKLNPEISRVFKENSRPTAPGNSGTSFTKKGFPSPAAPVKRVMRELSLQGVGRGRRRRTTIPDETAPISADLVERNFHALRPNELWVAVITYMPTWSGMSYAARAVR